MTKYIYLFILTCLLILSACNKEESNPITSTELQLAMMTDTVKVFYNQYIEINLNVISGNIRNIRPTLDQNEYENFFAEGPYFRDEAKTQLYVGILGTKLTSGPIVQSLAIHFGSNIVQVPICIIVQDFYYIHRFITNAPNDTIPLRKGGSFELHVTCEDSTGNIFSKQRIALMVGVQMGIMHSYPEYKLDFTNVEKDTTNIDVILFAFNDITPSVDDTSTYFTLDISNKQLKLPIKYIY